MSGNICAATNSPSPCSKATTTSSTNPAPPGASSPTTPNALPQSHPEPGRRSFLEAVGIIRGRFIFMPGAIDVLDGDRDTGRDGYGGTETWFCGAATALISGVPT